MIINDNFNNEINKPVRTITAKVELYNGSTLLNTFTAADRIISYSVERAGLESKFIGYGICQKLNIKLIDKNRELDINTAHSFKVFSIAGGEAVNALPVFYVTEVNRDENTNELSITAYDALYKAANFTVSELGLNPPYTIEQFLSACALLLNVGFDTSIKNSEYAEEILALVYEGGANFAGTEDIRAALDAAAEVALAIYYIDSSNSLKLKQLDIDGLPALTITKEHYITLKSGDNRRLANITHTTELGDNLTASSGVSGSTQYFRDNPFLELRDDAADILDYAIAFIGGLSINQFTCENWRGNPLLELGDKIELITKDNNSVFSYLLNDTISFDGSLSQATSWHYTEDEAETASNPTNLGEALTQTFARVNKAEKRIDLVVSETDENKKTIAALQLNTEGINATVEGYKDAIEGLNGELEEISSKVSATLTDEQIRAEITKGLSNGAEKVVTTGVTVDDNGLTVDKSNSDLKTTVSDNGVQVFKAGDIVLTANSEGVKAKDLHATTYLIIGNSSRFEDYVTSGGGKRTGCFWIGE